MAVTDAIPATPRLPVKPRKQVTRLASLGLTTADMGRLIDFYQRAFDCQAGSRERRCGHEFERQMAVRGGADYCALKLGAQTVELLQFDRPGRGYPQGLSPCDPAFQHFAIVVTDMRLAFERLSSVVGWTPISREGPQRLPANAGHVTAFKFRDPDGHPLELIEFAADRIPDAWAAPNSARVFIGIDHSAISVIDIARSIAFYEGLGLTVRSRSLNQGPEQRKLDGVSDPQVDVVALAPAHETPHVELLGYRTDTDREPAQLCSNDLVATRLVFQQEVTERHSDLAESSRSIRDPDGHCLHIVAVVDDESEGVSSEESRRRSRRY